MTLKSALEDLSRTTLEAVSGCLRKLEYLAGLRVDQQSYLHWGLSRVHGDIPANKALTTAHRTAVSRVLSTPLRTLLEDVERASTELGLAPEKYLEKLTEREALLLPQNPGAGARRHLSSVLRALLGLERHRGKNATRQAS
jgi:hypothetical protein